MYDYFLDFGFDFTKKSYSFRSVEKPDYVTIQKPITDSVIYNHLHGKIIVAMPRYKSTNVYAIDIDNHNGNNELAERSLQFVIQNLGIPDFIEQSKTNGGYHLFYKFNKPFLDEHFRLFQKYCMDKGFAVECLTGRKSLRLPFSCNYISGKINNGKFEPIYNGVARDLFKQAELKSVPEILTSLKYPVKKKYYLCPSRIANEGVDFTQKDFYYRAGERHTQQFRIALFAQSRRMTFSEFWNLCNLYNQGSKDMQRGSVYVEKMLRKIWEGAERNLKFYTTDSSSSGSQLYMSRALSNNDEKKLFEVFSHFSNRKNAKSKFIKDVIKLYEFLLSAKRYRTEKKYRYDNKFKGLSEGVPLGRDLRSLIASQLRISNIDEVYKFLLDNKFIKVITLSNGYSYSYKGIRFVKHFLVQTINSITKYFEKIKVAFRRIFRFDFEYEQIEVIEKGFGNKGDLKWVT